MLWEKAHVRGRLEPSYDQPVPFPDARDLTQPSPSARTGNTTSHFQPKLITSHLCTPKSHQVLSKLSQNRNTFHQVSSVVPI